MGTVNIQINKNLIATAIIAVMWFIAAGVFTVSLNYFFGGPVRLITMGIIFGVPTVITFFLLQILDHWAKPVYRHHRSNRVQRWLDSLDDDELDALRDRLQADELFEFKPKREMR
jgi:hypothetical protein